MEVTESPFLAAWHNAMIIGGIILIALGILIILIHHLRVSSIKDYKEKHDYINTNEIKWYKWAFHCFGLSVALFINLYAAGKVSDVGVWFFVRLFISLAGATLVGYVSYLVLEYYYPTQLNKKLRKWRYMPRVNPTTGNKMRLLAEDEEDVHLDEGMQHEENLFSIDYDVWLDEKSGDVKIEKYWGHLIALQCNNCGFYTMKVQKEEIVDRFEDGSPKELLKHYQCSYCQNLRATQFHISRKERDDYVHQKPKFARNTKNVDLVKIEIHSGLAGKKSYEFQTIEEAQKFLSEFDFNKVA